MLLWVPKVPLGGGFPSILKAFCVLFFGVFIILPPHTSAPKGHIFGNH